jgi:hypothetical protein
MTKINLLRLIDKEEKDFNSCYTDLEMSYLSKEEKNTADKIDTYYHLLDNIRQHAYKDSNRRVLKLLLLSKIIKRKKLQI